MDWHLRFRQQAAWTARLRQYLFTRAGLTSARRILEVGCGSASVLAEIAMDGEVHGLDICLEALSQARRNAPRTALTCGDVCRLPYAQGLFDLTFCHYLLLWVRRPLQALNEMRRVTRPGGYVLALAEPDYAHRVDRPRLFAWLGRLQREALRRQGADPDLGARLGELFIEAGLELLESGSLTPPDQDYRPPLDEWASEWAVLELDLRGVLPLFFLQALKAIDQRAWAAGRRYLFVPTYFALGRV